MYFNLLVSLVLQVTNYAIAFKICAITAGIKKYKSIFKKKKKNHDVIVLLAKSI